MDLLSPAQPDLFLEALCLERKDGVFQAGFCLARPPGRELLAGSARFLHPEEQELFATLKFERRQLSYLTGRFCAKHAIRLLRPDLSLSAIAIHPGVFQQPIVCADGLAPQISISHAADWGAALAFPEEHPMAIDIEEIKEERAGVVRSQVTDAEYGLVTPLAQDEIRALTLLWTVKEAMSKVIRCGMMTPFTLFEVGSAERAGPAIVCTFPNFAQYKTTTYWACGLAITLVSPKNSSFGHLQLANRHE
ncbi:MAG: 4'-phosphopantetheinyl transferase superfamily protein [Verrucomicrobia bacterium]|nr:4'-phosphopantetheinyl transferase superfamily protein [Verrucomicrobiota bacterium]